MAAAPRKDVTAEDLKATAAAKVDNVVESVEETVEDGVEKVDSLSINKKLLVTGLAAIAGSVVVLRVIAKIRGRKPVVIEVVEVEDEPTE